MTILDQLELKNIKGGEPREERGKSGGNQEWGHSDTGVENIKSN